MFNFDLSELLPHISKMFDIYEENKEDIENNIFEIFPRDYKLPHIDGDDGDE